MDFSSSHYIVSFFRSSPRVFYFHLLTFQSGVLPFSVFHEVKLTDSYLPLWPSQAAVGWCHVLSGWWSSCSVIFCFFDKTLNTEVSSVCWGAMTCCGTSGATATCGTSGVYPHHFPSSWWYLFYKAVIDAAIHATQLVSTFVSSDQEAFLQLQMVAKSSGFFLADWTLSSCP